VNGQQHYSRIKGLLVIVSCGRGKIWSRRPDQGPIAARDAYTGSPFKVNCSGWLGGTGYLGQSPLRSSKFIPSEERGVLRF